MTRGRPKKTTVTTIEEPLDENLQANIEEVEIKPGEQEQELQDYIHGLGESNLIVKIFKHEIGRTSPAYCAQTNVDMASESFIQENFGAGTYQVRCFLNGKFKGAKTIKINEGIKKEEPPTVYEPLPGADAGTSFADPMTLQMQMIREEARTNREILMKLLENNSKGKSGTMELAEIMVMMKGLQPAATASDSPMKMFAEMIPFVREIMKLMGGNVPEEEPTGWLGIAKQVITEVPNMLKLMKSAPSNPPGQAPGPVLMQEGSPVVIPPEMAKQLQWAFQFLKTRVRVGADPLAFVDFAMNTLDMEQSLNVVKLLDRSYEEIATIDPEILDPVYRPWFTEFFKGLHDAIQQRNDTGGGGGDGSDAPENEGIDAPGGAKRPAP